MPVVIKVGGSLLTWPELPSRLGAYLGARSSERLVLVAGGGPAADFVRDLDRAHAPGDVAAHELAVRSLDLTAHALAAVVPGLVAIATEADLAPAWAGGRVPVLAPRLVLDADDRESSEPLPRSWAVTADAIAARIAARLGARALILLKSAPLPPGADLEDAVRLGLVDPSFPCEARALRRVFYRDLRDPEGAEIPLQDAG